MELDIESLDSMLVQDNKDYQDCLQILKDFNRDLKTYQKKNQVLKNGPWKLQFVNGLFHMLSEVVFTKEPILQNSFAEKCKNWAIDQLVNLESDGKLSILEIDKLKELQTSNKVSFETKIPHSVSDAAKTGQK